MKPVCRQMKWSHFVLYASVGNLRDSYHGSLACCLCSEIMSAIEAEIISLESSIWKRNGWYYYTLATISKGKFIMNWSQKACYTAWNTGCLYISSQLWFQYTYLANTYSTLLHIFKIHYCVIKTACMLVLYMYVCGYS